MAMINKNSAYWDLVRKSRQQDNLAKKCIGCPKNTNSWCEKHFSWCSKAKKDCSFPRTEE